jgi:hypothetical protein
MTTETAADIALNVFQHKSLYVETSLSKRESGIFVVGNKLDRNGEKVGIYKVAPVKHVFEIFVEVALIVDQLIADARRIEDRPRYEQHDTEAWLNIKRNVIENRLDDI